jgi:hypothetical protein
MDWWRISKYDPAFRDGNYVYQRNEWTSVTDIGRTFDGATLDVETYLATETAHVEAVRAFMVDAGVTVLTVTDLEPPDGIEFLQGCGLPDLADLSRRLQGLTDGVDLSGPALDESIRLLLRQAIWCRLVHSDRFVVDVDEYLYVSVGTVADSSRAIARTLELGLFVEKTRDPST